MVSNLISTAEKNDIPETTLTGLFIELVLISCPSLNFGTRLPCTGEFRYPGSGSHSSVS